MNIAASADRDLRPLEIDPRLCGECGLTIDQHHMVDNGEGPEFFCQEISYVERIIWQWETDDLKRPLRATVAPKQQYRTPQSTVDTFWYVVGICDPERLKAWLRNHPRDTPFLLKLLERK